MRDCPFCEIGQGETPPHCLYDDSRLFVLLDRASLAFGHCMVIPKVHVTKVYELPEEIRRPFFEFAATAARKLERALGVRAVGLVAFGSGLPHAHLHLVPHDDPEVLNNPLQWIRTKNDEELAEEARQLSEVVSLGA